MGIVMVLCCRPWISSSVQPLSSERQHVCCIQNRGNTMNRRVAVVGGGGGFFLKYNLEIVTREYCVCWGGKRKEEGEGG